MTTTLPDAGPRNPDEPVCAAISTRDVRDGHRAVLLRLIARVGWVHRHEVAMELFITRSFSAATRAARRAIRSAIDAGLVERRSIDCGPILYGLTRRGGRWLEDNAHAGEIRPTLSALREASHIGHRRMAAQVAILGEKLGCRALHERECLQRCDDLVQAYGKLPDTLLEWTEVAEDTATVRKIENLCSWHEIELTRRNKRSRNALKCALEHLVRAKGKVVRDGCARKLVAVVFHVRRGGAERELRNMLRALCADHGWPTLDVGDHRLILPGLFTILIEPLPPLNHWPATDGLLLPWRLGATALPREATWIAAYQRVGWAGALVPASSPSPLRTEVR